MKKFKLFGLLTLSLALVLTACGGGSSSSKGTNFRVAIGGKPAPLDTALSSDAVTHYITAQLYDTLFSYDQEGNVISNLAESLEISEDGLTYTIKLVDTVWSDGEKLTAEHVVYGVKRALNFGGESTYAHYIFKNIVNTNEYVGKPIETMTNIGVKAIDDLTVEMQLISPLPYFKQLLTGEVFAPQRPDVAKEGDSSFAIVPGNPTSGAYTLKSVNEGQEYVLAKNPNYRFADKVKLETLTFIVMEDQQAQLNAFKTGEIEFATSVPSDVVHTYEGKPELAIFKPYVINYFISVNAFKSVDELKDVNVRRALGLSIDRAQIIKALNGGELQYELFGIVAKGIPGAKGDFREEQDKVKKYLDTNKEEAKALLAKAGFSASNPLKLEYRYNSNAMHDTVAEALQAMWKEVGIEVTLAPSETRVFFNERDLGEFQLARHAMSADFLDPMIYLEMYDSRRQITAVIDDKKYDEMLDAANRERDNEKRMNLLHDAESYLVDEQAYVIPLFGYANPYLIKAGVKNITSNPQGSLDLRFVELP